MPKRSAPKPLQDLTPELFDTLTKRINRSFGRARLKTVELELAVLKHLEAERVLFITKDDPKLAREEILDGAERFADIVDPPESAEPSEILAAPDPRIIIPAGARTH